MTNMAITRRGFMKAAATATAALGVAGAPVLLDEVDQAFADSIPKREKHKTACHGCTNCCPVCVYTEDGVVVKIEGDPDGPLNKGGVCLKCLSQIQTVYSPRHVLHPMKRVGEPVGGDFLGRGHRPCGRADCNGCRKVRPVLLLECSRGWRCLYRMGDVGSRLHVRRLQLPGLWCLSVCYAPRFRFHDVGWVQLLRRYGQCRSLGGRCGQRRA